MKYSISDMRAADMTPVDVTRFFDKPEGTVTMWVKRLTNEKRNVVIAMTMKGQEFRDGNVEIKDTSWLQKARIIELLHGVHSQAADFPFETWDEQFITALDERNPEFVETIADAVREMNAPLAPKSGEKSET